MSCQHCKSKRSGRYDFNCHGCCAKLIRNARPVKALQNAQISALSRFHGAAWPAVWVEVKTMLDAA